MPLYFELLPKKLQPNLLSKVTEYTFVMNSWVLANYSREAVVNNKWPTDQNMYLLNATLKSFTLFNWSNHHKNHEGKFLLSSF